MRSRNIGLIQGYKASFPFLICIHALFPIGLLLAVWSWIYPRETSIYLLCRHLIENFEIRHSAIWKTKVCAIQKFIYIHQMIYSHVIFTAQIYCKQPWNASRETTGVWAMLTDKEGLSERWLITKWPICSTSLYIQVNHAIEQHATEAKTFAVCGTLVSYGFAGWF